MIDRFNLLNMYCKIYLSSTGQSMGNTTSILAFPHNLFDPLKLNLIDLVVTE